MASWTYVHTGGLPLTDLSVVYSYEEGASTVSQSVNGVSLNDLSVTVSGLVAGEEYTFTVTAENSNGSSSTVYQPVNHIIGEPSLSGIKLVNFHFPIMYNVIRCTC